MSTGCQRYAHVVWITVQLMMTGTYFGAGPAMAIARFEPYVSEFDFASRFHPSKNPNCPNAWSGSSGDDNDEFSSINFSSRRSQPGPEESSPVGPEPSIEVRAVLVRCPKSDEKANEVLINRNIYNTTAGRSQDMLYFHGFDGDESPRHSEVRECRKKLVITMKFNNIGRTKTQEEFVVIDHVLDPITMHKARLLNPFVVKVRQEPILQLYGLKFQGVVNAEAREEVINKKMSNYTGCDDFSDNPTCGQMIYQGKPIPYSQGFCCSCDSQVNSQREASVFNESVVSSLSDSSSNSNDVLIEPLKSPRSMNDQSSDGLLNLENALKNKAVMSGKLDGETKFNRHGRFESGLPFHENNDFAIAQNSHDDETDLIRLKGSNGLNRKIVNPAACMMDGKMIKPYNEVDYRKCLNEQLNALQTVGKDHEVIESLGGSEELARKMITTHEPMETRHMTKSKNSDHVILTAELANLEQDYKNLQLANLIRMRDRNNVNYDIARNATIRPWQRKYSGQTRNVDGTDRSLSTERIENAKITRMGSENKKRISTFVYTDKSPLQDEETLDSRIPTLSVDVLFAIRPKGKPTACHVDSTIALSKAQSTERMTTQSVSKAGTPAILRQKLVSDRVYPSSGESDDYKIDRQQRIGDSNSMELTTDLSRKFVPDTENLQNVATFDDAKFFNRTHSYSGQSRSRKMYGATSTELSIITSTVIARESDVTSEGTTLNSQQADDPIQSFATLSVPEDSSANSSSSLSSDNHARGNAIMLKGLLKNRSADWLPYDKRNNGGQRRRNKSRVDYGKLNAVGYNGGVGLLRVAVPKSASDDSISRNRYEDRSTTIVDRQRPLQIYLEPDNTYESPDQTENRKLVPKTYESKKGFPNRVFLESSDRKEPVNALWNKSGASNSPRSYRSVADENSFTPEDAQQQRSIDEKIEDEFLDISEALKDAAGNSKIIGGRPNDESMFVQDDPVMDQLNSIVNEISGESMMKSPWPIEGNSMLNSSVVEGDGKSEVSRYDDEFVTTKTPRAMKHDRPVDGFELRRISPTTEKSGLFSVGSNPSTMRKLSKYNNSLPIDGQVLEGTAAPTNNENDDQSKIVKQSEKLMEPISEIPQTTDHQIIVDRFKLVNTFQTLPNNDKQTFDQIVPTFSTHVPSNMQNSKEEDRTTHARMRSYKNYKNHRDTVSDIFRNLGSNINIDRSEPVDRPQVMANKEQLREKVSRHSSFTNVLPEMRNDNEKEVLTGTIPKPIAIVMLDSNFTNQSDNLLRSVLSPASMIDNLKKELRKEAERYNSESTTSERTSASTFVDQNGRVNFDEKFREVTTEPSSVENMKDSVTYEGLTLPPDEQTNLAISHHQTITVTSTVGRDSAMKLARVNEIVLPSPAIRNLKKSFSSEAAPAKKNEETFIVVEEPLQSLSTRYFTNIRNHKKRHSRRRHHERANRGKRLSIDRGVDEHANIGPAADDGHAVVNGKSENEDDDLPRHETTSSTEITKNLSNAMIPKSIGNIDPMRLTSKNLKRREIPLNLANVNEIPELADTFSNEATSSTGLSYVSPTSNPKSHGHSRLAGLRINELPKVDTRQTSQTAINVNADEVGIPTVSSYIRGPENWEEVDELPIFQRIQSPRPRDKSQSKKSRRVGKKDFEYDRKIRNIEEVAKNNFQTLSTSRFRSFYPKSNEISLINEPVVDDATGSSDVEGNNKREDSNESNDIGQRAVIFYDYDAIDTDLVAPTTTSQNDENKRSLEIYDPEDNEDNKIQSRAKSSAGVSEHFERQPLEDQNNYPLTNNNVNSILDKEYFEKIQESPETTEVNDFLMQHTKLGRSENTSGNQLKIGPPGGWKEKMELLKLKKHADVLKEYLNWHHDIVGSDPHGIAEYTTKISVTNEREERITEFVTAEDSYVSNKEPLSSTFVTHISTIDNVIKTTNVHEDLTMTTNLKNDDDVTNETGTLNPWVSSPIPRVTNDSGNDLFDKTNNTSTIETSTDYGRYETENTIFYENKAGTGRILPTCCPTTKAVHTSPIGLHKNVNCLTRRPDPSELPHATPKVIHNPEHNQKQSNTVDNDLVIISVLERNRLKNKNVDDLERGDSPKIYRIRNDVVPDLVSRHRLEKSKNKDNYPATDVIEKTRLRRKSGRRLMYVENLDFQDDEDDSVVDDFEAEVNMESAVDGDSSGPSDNADSEKLENKWNQLIDKVMNNNSLELWKANSTKSSLPELSDDNLSAMKELHFINADKYIKQIARKIGHGSSLHPVKHEPGAFSDGKKTRNNIVPRRRLKSYSNPIRRRIARKATMSKNENFGNYGESMNEERSASALGSKTEDAYDDPRDFPTLPLNSARSASSNISLRRETSDQDKTGRDFAISLSGKIHVEGGTNGRPMSISFDTSPELVNENETNQDDSNENLNSENSTNAETDPSPKLLSNLFNIAPVPKDLTHHSQKSGGNANATVSRRQSSRVTGAKKSRRSRESYHRKFPHRGKKLAYVRKSRAVDEETAVRWPNYRSDRSFDWGVDSQDSDDFSVHSDSKGYPESFFVDNNDIEHKEMEENRLTLPKQRNSDAVYFSPYINENLIHQGHTEPHADVKVIKIIPLSVEKSIFPLPPSASRRNDDRDGKEKDVRVDSMEASDLAEMEEDNFVPHATVKPGKIKPAELPWVGNDSTEDKSGLKDKNNSQRYSMGSGSCPPVSESGEGNLARDDSDHRPVDYPIPTGNPVSLKVIGLVSMDQPSNNKPKSPIGNADANYGIVPLIRVKIEQRPNNSKNLDSCKDNFPGGPDKAKVTLEGCPKIDTTKSSHHVHDDDSYSCSDVNDEASNRENDGNSERAEVTAVDMRTDLELGEPTEMGSCAEDNRMDRPTVPNFADDHKLDRIRPIEEPHSCGDQREPETTSESSCQYASKIIDARKRIRLKNMLAIMKFIKKIRGMMREEEPKDMVDTDENGAVVNLATVVILPINRSQGIPETPTDFDDATERVIMIGEGVRHGFPQNRVTPDRNNLGNGERNGTVKQFNTECNVNETKWNKTSWKDATQDQDKSFLFYDNDNKIGAAKQATSNDKTFYEPPLTDGEHESASGPTEQGFGERDPFESFKSILAEGTNNVITPRFEESSMIKNFTNSSVVDSNDVTNANEVQKVNDTQHGNKSNGLSILQNLRKEINERLWGHKSDDSEKMETWDLESSDSTKARSAVDNEFPSVAKTKRDRLRSNGMSYDSGEPRRKIYRSRSSPDGEVSQLGKQKFRRLASNTAIRGGQRRKKKKKRMKKKRRRKKKKHKKKGKIHRDVENSRKPWWPFRRQLMSLSEERQRAGDIGVDRDDIGGMLIDESRHRRDPLTLGHRRIRKVHRAKYLHGRDKKNKTRRKHKKSKKKKKKNQGNKKSMKIRLRNKRQINSGAARIRGEQNCEDREHPSDVNPAKYLESAHCLRFSDLWYSVFELEDPIMEHTVYLQLFEKHNRADGTSHWEDLTQGSMVRMGSFTRHQRDSKPTIAFTYSGAKTDPRDSTLNLNPSSDRLLIPSPVPPKKASTYPEIKGGSGEYLVVKASSISPDGNECDKAGVGFAAFSKQKYRCDRPMGSCLKNQPLAYWRHDTKARESGRRGCYFLSNFASVPTKPIKHNVSGSGSREYLGLEYHSTHVSAIDIEVRTDYNAIVRVGSSGRVTEVYVDSTALEHTVVTVVISNMGLASSPYQSRITDCPTGLPVSWTTAKANVQVIPPQHDHRVTMDLYGRLLLNEFHCSVELINHRGELVAMRRIKIQRMNRCFCVWHCLCACIGSVSGMGCQPMSPEHYHAAGFQGPVPVVTADTSVLMNTVKNVLIISALLVLLLLILGTLKWFVGMFTPAVGRWGLDRLLDGTTIDEYFEPELRCRCVMTDDDGWPVHPDTGQRTVRICSRKLEFFLNLIFFLTYPIAVCCTYCKRSLNSSRQRRCCPDESKMCLINDKGSCPKMICVSTYGDSRNSKLEAEDTRYVMNELKKSQESLEHPKRSKRTGGTTNSPKRLSKKSSRGNKSSSDVSAKLLVDDLLKSRIVFRNLREPVGGLRVQSGTWYSLRGYFLNAEDGGYRFITPCPFKQHWLIENNQRKASKPPEPYPSNLFMRSFRTARDVYESNELSLDPIGICINVQRQEDT